MRKHQAPRSYDPATWNRIVADLESRLAVIESQMLGKAGSDEIDHTHNLADLAERSYESLTDRPAIENFRLNKQKANLTANDRVLVWDSVGRTYKWVSGSWFQPLNAEGLIVMWSGALADVPTGWQLCDGSGASPDLRDKFIYGWTDAVDPGGTGGTATHSHTTGAPSATTNVTAGAVAVASSDHTHTTDAVNHLPPYYKLAFIMWVGN